MDEARSSESLGFICKCMNIYVPKNQLLEHLALPSTHALSKASSPNYPSEDIKISIERKIRNILKIQAEIQQASVKMFKTINQNTLNAIHNLEKLAQIYRNILSDQPRHLDPSLNQMEIVSTFRVMDSLDNALIKKFEQKTISQNWTILESAKSAESKIAEIYDNHFDILICVVASSDESFLVTGGRERYIRVWDLKSKSQMYYLNKHKGEVMSIAILSGDKFLLSGSLDCTVRLWNLENRKQEFKFKGHTHYVTSVLISKDSKYGYSGSWDGTVIVWNLRKKSIKSKIDFIYNINQICLMNEDKTIFAVGGHGNISLADLDNEGLKEIQENLEIHIKSICFSNSENNFVVGYDNGLMQIWDTKSFNVILEENKHTAIITKIELISNSNLFATCSIDGIVLIWDFTENCLVHTIKYQYPIHSIFYLKNSQTMAIAQTYSWIIFYNLRNQNSCKEINQNFIQSETISISSDLKYMAYGKQKLTLFDLVNNKMIKELPNLKIICTFIKFYSDGSYLGYGNFSGEIFILKIPCLTLKYSYNYDKYPICALAFSVCNNLIGYSANSQVKIQNISLNRNVYCDKAYFSIAIEFCLNDQKFVYADKYITFIIVNKFFVKEVVLNLKHAAIKIIAFEKRDFIIINDSASKFSVINLVTDELVCDEMTKKEFREWYSDKNELKCKAIEKINQSLIR